MLSFKSFITEDLAPKSLDKAMFIISKYLKKQTGLKMFAYPGVEEFDAAGRKGFGMRYFLPKKNQSFRLEWKLGGTTGVGLASLTSITFWNGHDPKPYIITFSTGQSVIKVLPIIAKILKTNTVPKVVMTMPDDVPLNESIIELSEQLFLAEEADFTPADMLDGIVDLITQPNFSKGKVYGRYKGAGYKIFDEIERRYPNLIYKAGTQYVWDGKDKDATAIKKQSASILAAIGVDEASVTRGSSAAEKYKGDEALEALENQRERLTFQKQLVDLENLTRLTIGGASNALFVAGKGGVGKTHTVEKILGSMGYRDGENMFKNTGSTSAAGLYLLLYKYQNDLILFDDCDSVFKDQESRNVLKAATDTKKIRKLVWNKRGSGVMNPDDFSKDEILDAGAVPQNFEFTGRIVFISNLKMDQLDPDGALRTRGYMISIDPTDAEIYEFMDAIVAEMPLKEGLKLDLKARKHVVELLRKGGSKQSPNLRMLDRGLNMAAAAIVAGVDVPDDELARMISSYS
jgi:hypothetical protein